jgi:hypothetical protein
METKAGGAQRTAPLAGTDVIVSAPPGSAKTCQELRWQLDAAVAFADYCAFLTAGSGSDRASALVDVAEELFDETLQALGQRAALGHQDEAFEQDGRWWRRGRATDVHGPYRSAEAALAGQPVDCGCDVCRSFAV